MVVGTREAGHTECVGCRQRSEDGEDTKDSGASQGPRISRPAVLSHKDLKKYKINKKRRRRSSSLLVGTAFPTRQAFHSSSTVSVHFIPSSLLQRGNSFSVFPCQCQGVVSVGIQILIQTVGSLQ